MAADLVIPRLNLRTLTRGDLYILELLEGEGVEYLNPIAGIEAARSKIITLQLLEAAGLPVPATVVVRSWDRLAEAHRLLGGGRCVVKPGMGSQGRDVVRVEGWVELEAEFRSRWTTDRHAVVLVQEYLAPENGPAWDLRVVLLLGQVVGAMRREAVGGDFRTNYSLGGAVTLVDPAPELVELARAATGALGLDLAGVDILVDRDGPRILEVNANPGWEGISAAMTAAGSDFHTRFLEILESRWKR
jgi:ribosomal protein S6--L-glutamate ligase